MSKQKYTHHFIPLGPFERHMFDILMKRSFDNDHQSVAIDAETIETLLHAAIRYRDSLTWRSSDPEGTNEAGRLAFADKLTLAIDCVRDALEIAA